MKFMNFAQKWIDHESIVLNKLTHSQIRQKVPFHSHILDPSLCVYVCVSIKPIKLENRPRDIKMHYVLG